MITPAIEPQLYRAIIAKVQELGGVVHAIGGMEDHVHLALSAPPTVTLSDFIGQVKGNSSHFVNHQCHPEVPFAWQREYGVLTFGEKYLNNVIDYVQNQRHHHEMKTVYRGMECTVEEESG
jgi:putative transposase